MTPIPQETIQRAQKLATLLLVELADMTDNLSLLNQLGDVMSDPEGNGSQLEAQIQQTFRNAVSLPSRAAAMKDLAEALKALATLERQASGTRKQAVR